MTRYSRNLLYPREIETASLFISVESESVYISVDTLKQTREIDVGLP